MKTRSLIAAAVRAGALDAADVIVMPGGGCAAQYKALGDKGVEALR
jgi:hypothetical protein